MHSITTQQAAMSQLLCAVNQDVLFSILINLYSYWHYLSLVVPKLANYCSKSASERLGVSKLSTENNFGVPVCSFSVK